MIHSNIDIAAAFSHSEQVAAIGENAAAVGLPQIDERESAILVSRTVLQRRPAVEIHTPRNATNTCNVNRSLSVSTIARLESAHDKRNRTARSADRCQQG